ncbi:hypothetical protein CSC70_11755 [Pseudoxanthomonas kalamensis DSM 18571]|uniref:hypothetical protein n=1 Tax=Pseudoxanthomonas kalamensis TaxID=289483 RepID=UPI001390F13F|nr:hypothetical protein [Pseudoxanthomonas kalamensis]KAF1708782.1 hypothetical protein CSC70_11755 [Pseudoxanthomonas kalamensis DSM 18571]
MPAMVRIFPTVARLMGVALLLSACASVPPDPAGSGAAVAPADPLAAVMAGEFALQSGQLEDASRWYLQAAQAGTDAGLAERATRISLLANEDANAAQALALWRQRAPATEAMRSAGVVLALREGREQAAHEGLLELLKADDETGWQYALTVLGDGGRDPALSARLLQRLLDEQALPDALPAWLAAGGLAQKLDQPELTRRIVGEAADRFPDEPGVALLHASQLNDAGQADQARAVLAGLAEDPGLTPEQRISVAYEYDNLGDPVAAAGVLAMGPQDGRSFGFRAWLLGKAKDDAALAALYDEARAADSDPDDERRLLLGRIAEALKRHAQALDWYRSIPQGEHFAEAQLRAANSLYALERKDQAFAEVHRLQGDAGLDDEARVGAYLLEAELRQKDKDDGGELDALARGLSAYPDDASLLYARGLAWERRNRIDRAEADLRKILVIDPEDTAALNALGYTLADRTTRYQEALELIARARVAEPDNAAIIDSYGWVLYRLGRSEEALVELRRAWMLMKDPEVAAHLGEVLWVLGQQDEARRFFDEARKLDPENRSLLRALEKTGA